MDFERLVVLGIHGKSNGFLGSTVQLIGDYGTGLSPLLATKILNWVKPNLHVTVIDQSNFNLEYGNHARLPTSLDKILMVEDKAL